MDGTLLKAMFLMILFLRITSSALESCSVIRHIVTLRQQNERSMERECVQQPAAILSHVLDHLHPQKGCFLVLCAQNFLWMAGGYAEVRERIAKRFASIEITILPDRAFAADSEIALLIATDPIPHRTCRVVNRRVNDDPVSWSQFEFALTVSLANMPPTFPSMRLKGHCWFQNCQRYGIFL